MAYAKSFWHVKFDLEFLGQGQTMKMLENFLILDYLIPCSYSSWEVTFRNHGWNIHIFRWRLVTFVSGCCLLGLRCHMTSVVTWQKLLVDRGQLVSRRLGWGWGVPSVCGWLPVLSFWTSCPPWPRSWHCPGCICVLRPRDVPWPPSWCFSALCAPWAGCLEFWLSPRCSADHNLHTWCDTPGRIDLVYGFCSSGWQELTVGCWRACDNTELL